jgi:YHS domain-containing protein
MAIRLAGVTKEAGNIGESAPNPPAGTSSLRYKAHMPFTRRASLAFAFALISSAVMAGEPAPLAIKGYDPVAYFAQQRATPGVAQFEYEWDEHRWHFSSAENRDLFKVDPVRYAPQFANFCAVALARGELHEANPEYWLISDGKLYLFGKPYGPEVFRKDLKRNIERANEHRSMLPKT